MLLIELIRGKPIEKRIGFKFPTVTLINLIRCGTKELSLSPFNSVSFLPSRFIPFHRRRVLRAELQLAGDIIYVHVYS